MSKWHSLRAQRDFKYSQIRLLEDQAKLLSREIELRENMIKGLYEKAKIVRDEAQEIADEMLGIEYRSLIKAGI